MGERGGEEEEHSCQESNPIARELEIGITHCKAERKAVFLFLAEMPLHKPFSVHTVHRVIIWGPQ